MLTGQNIDLPAGNTRRVSVTITGTDGKALNLTGCLLQWAAFRDGQRVILKDVYTGTITITDQYRGLVEFTLAPADTKSLAGQTLNHELEMTDAEGNITTLLSGKLIVQRALITTPVKRPPEPIIQIVGTKGRMYYDTGSGFSSADGVAGVLTDTMTTRSFHYAVQKVSRFRLAFGTNLSYTRPFRVRCAMEKDGYFYPVYFKGDRWLTIVPGMAIQYSDDLAGPALNEGDPFYIRTVIQTEEPGVAGPGNLYITDGGFLEGIKSGDTVDGGAYGKQYGNTTGYGPLFVMGVNLEEERPVIAFVGDSIFFGMGANALYNGNDYTQSGARSFIEKGLKNRFGYLNLGKVGESAQSFADNNAANLLNRYRIAAIQQAGCSVAIVDYGVNDWKTLPSPTLEQLKGWLQGCWDKLHAMGLRVYQTTITPVTSSTDNWATAGSQSIRDPQRGHTLDNAVRAALNDWILTLPAPLSGAIDSAVQVETARNSGIWKPGYTVDGIHPNNTAALAMATAVDPNIFY